MERWRIFSITFIISSVVQSCCDSSNGWVDITESSRVGDIIGNIQGHSMTSFKNVRVIFVLISHLFNKLKIHTTGCRRHWRCGFRRFLDFVLLEVCVFLEITIFWRVARDVQTGLDEQSAPCDDILQRWERWIGALAVRRYRYERCTVGFVVFLEFAILDIHECVVAKSILALGFKNKKGRIDSLRRSHIQWGKRTFENSQRRLD